MTIPESPQPKRGGRKPAAFVRADARHDGASLVCYISIRGYVFSLFNDADLDIASGCRPLWQPRRGGYVIASHATAVERTTGRKSMVYAHQLVLERKLGRPLDVRASEVVDHTNGDPLDNRRGNLRAVSQRGNGQNRRDQVLVPAGVAWAKDRRK